MHPLNNGSQVEQVPELKPRVGIAGYFSESNEKGAPSYPGQDWFNAVIREFQAALSASGVEFDPDKFDHLQKMLVANGNQFAPYRADRTYKTGEVCCTLSDGEVKFWQWYSNVESLSGKSPLLEAHRHLGWTDNTKPFYWLPYTGDQVGMPFFWLDTTAPEWAVMEINVDLPVAVYWRLARRYSHLVSGGMVNTGEIRGEFLRVLDQGREVDDNRVIGSAQDATHLRTAASDYLGRDQAQMAIPATAFSNADSFGSPTDATVIKNPNGTDNFWGSGQSDNGFTAQMHTSSIGGGNFISMRSRNVARPMAISI